MAQERTRVLVIDDNKAIHETFHKLLLPPERYTAELDALEAELFGAPVTPRPSPGIAFELDVAQQGEVGLARVEAALAEGRPYVLAFVDMRMPPGWDGLRTIRELWNADSRLEIVICTAYSDVDWSSALRELGNTDKLLVLKKPFDGIEVVQMAQALAYKWRLQRELEKTVQSLRELIERRTDELSATQRELQRARSLGRKRDSASHDSE